MSPKFQSVTQTILDHHGPLTLVMLGLILIISCVILVRVFKKQTSKEITELQNQLNQLGDGLQKLMKMFKEESAQNRNESVHQARLDRDEMGNGLRRVTDGLLQRMTENAGMQKDQLDSFARQLVALTRLNDEKSEAIRKSVEVQLGIIRDQNNQKLEQIRQTVNEQLHVNLEKKVGESFKQVSERLEQVYRGLGEMQHLANGVGGFETGPHQRAYPGNLG